jgi:hypothetical protein
MSNSNAILASGYFLSDLIIDGLDEAAKEPARTRNWIERTNQRLSSRQAAYYIDKLTRQTASQSGGEDVSTASLLERSVATSAGFGLLSNLLASCSL